MRFLVLHLLLAYGSAIVEASRAVKLSEPPLGPRDRFWRHHRAERTLVYDGIDHYQNIETCLEEQLTSSDKAELAKSSQRSIGQTKLDPTDNSVVLVIVKDAMLPAHIKAVQAMAHCVRKFLPHLYESRPMYQEYDLKEDPGLGGNCPTHLAPILSIFLPDVTREMQLTLETAYDAAGWTELVQRDRSKGVHHREALTEPENVGIRASEHLTYNDFPKLASHHDGSATAYTMNFAFSDEYQGGEFFILTERHGKTEKALFKPNKGDAIIFLGGRYMHGVEEITGGTREMFSTEWWPYPDTPFGSTLWTNVPQNIEKYIALCNEEVEQGLNPGGQGPCQAELPTTTGQGVDMTEVREKYGHEEMYRPKKPHQSPADSKRPNRIKPQPLVATHFVDQDGKEYDMDSFFPRHEEPHFMIPKVLEPAEMVPIRWRDGLDPIDGPEGESYVIGFPPELLREFQAYLEHNGMMEVARKLLYEERKLRPGEHRLYTLEDGNQWGAMIQGSWDTDMIWLDPADEACFESLLGVLRRGNFDKILDKVGKTFDLDGLMVQGVGAIFLSQYEHSRNMHIDIPGSKGSFYNVIVPVHIPENRTAGFYVAENFKGSVDDVGMVGLRPDVGLVLGGESYHGTKECDYRDIQDFRLSFAIYVADINDDNIDLIASDSTSLWPSEGDTDWFRAQKGRLWSKHDSSRSLKNDEGRKPMNVEDKYHRCPELQHTCKTDVTGLRLKCPKTCELYMTDEVYYSKLKEEVSPSQPTCNVSSEPTCKLQDSVVA